MTSYYINPTVSINDSGVVNIMSIMANNISEQINYYKNITEEQVYNTISDIVFNLMHNCLKIYKFFPGISIICVQIYNETIDVVFYMNFYITGAKFKIIKSQWYDFYYRINSPTPIVYNGMSIEQQNDLTFALINKNFFMINDLEFTYQSTLIKSVILTNSLKNKCECECERECERECKQKYKYNLAMAYCCTGLNYNYVTTIYWY